jgi:hypothetical protein
MPLPNNFSEFEHLQDQVRRIHNQDVRGYFGGVADEDISTARGSLKQACLMKDSDTATMTMMRLWLFEFTAGKGRRLEPAIFDQVETPLAYSVLRTYKPQLRLFFREDIEDVEAGYRRVVGEIRMRLMDQSTTTISMAEATAYGNKIKTLFGSGGGFVWRRGKEMCTYFEPERGYALKLLSRNESEGKRIVEQVLDIQNHTPDWARFQVSKNDQPSQSFPTIPPRETILGKSVRLPRRRPMCDVRYQYAHLKIQGRARDLVLHDRTYRFRDALVS